MKRVIACSGLLVAAALAVVPVLRADVTTKEKTTFKMEGLMGSMVNRVVGNDATATVAVKGNRMARMTEKSGHIIDLAEEKFYQLDMGRKEYTVMTFAEFRQMMQDAKQKMQEQSAKTSPEDKQAMQDAAKNLEFDVASKETGQTKTILGHNAKEVVMTITMHEKGKKIEESGGMIMTNTHWVAPKIAALDELIDFHFKFAKAVGLGAMVDAQAAGMLSAVIPGFAQFGEKMAAEAKKLQGTTLSLTSVWESVKSPEAMKQAQSSGGGGGGIGGMLAGKLMKKGAVEPRSKMLTTTNDTLSIAETVNAADLAIPAGFKEKKK